MIKWQYLVLEKTNIAKLDSLGQKGWELVAVNRDRGFDIEVFWVFKRPVTDVAEGE